MLRPAFPPASMEAVLTIRTKNVALHPCFNGRPPPRTHIHYQLPLPSVAQWHSTERIIAERTSKEPSVEELGELMGGQLCPLRTLVFCLSEFVIFHR
jgi:hypothetical protein